MTLVKQHVQIKKTDEIITPVQKHVDVEESIEEDPSDVIKVNEGIENDKTADVEVVRELSQKSIEKVGNKRSKPGVGSLSKR